MKKEIKICPACTKFNRDEIQKLLEENGHTVKFGCIVYCRDREETKHPYFGLFNGIIHEYETYEEFIEAANK